MTESLREQIAKELFKTTKEMADNHDIALAAYRWEELEEDIKLYYAMKAQVYLNMVKNRLGRVEFTDIQDDPLDGIHNRCGNIVWDKFKEALDE